MSAGEILIRGLSCRYPGRTEPSLVNVNLGVDQGGIVLVTGPTGCGKSTLLKCICGIIPHESGGAISGLVQVGGLDTKKSSLHEITAMVGLVFQNPDEQLFAALVEDEVAFGPRNRGFPPDEVDKAVDRALGQVGLAGFRHRGVEELSGGQKQRLVLAGQLSVAHPILCLDEPFSQMDPRGAVEVRGALKRLAHDHRITVIIVEHRIHEVADLVDRVVVMDHGAIILDKPSDRAFDDLEPFHRLGLSLPQTIEICGSLGLKHRPLDPGSAAGILKSAGPRPIGRTGGIQRDRQKDNMAAPEEQPGAVIIKNLDFAYTAGNPVFRDFNLEVGTGERVAVMGPNGCGKTTLLLLIASLLRCGQGEITVGASRSKKRGKGRMSHEVGILFQNPDLMIIREKVFDELAFGPRNKRFSGGEVRALVRSALKAMTIEDLEHDYCFSLSRGQRLRVALASVLSMDPDVILLDEPTTGQDRGNISEMMAHLINLGKTVVFSTHDILTAAEFATRLVVLKSGRIIYDGTPAGFFAPGTYDSESALTPTHAARLGALMGFKAPALTVSEFLSQWCER